MPKVVKEPLAGWYQRITRYRKYMILGAVAIIASIFLHVDFHFIVLVPILFVVSAFSMNYRRIIRVPPGFELMSLTTVAVGYTHGPLAGAIYGLLVAFTAEVLSGGIDPFILSYVPGRAIQGALAGYFASVDFIVLGLILVVVYNIIAQSLYLLQGDPEARLKTAAYVFTNFGLNLILFTLLGSFVVKILS